MRANALPDEGDDGRWLVDELWLDEAVGIIGGSPKTCKTWLALDLAVSVASATPCLGRFPVTSPGKVLVHNGEERPAVLKQRVSSICAHRGVELAAVDVSFVDTPNLDLLSVRDWRALEETVRAESPKLLVLDPFVRMFRGNEDDAGQVSRVLGRLRKLQREHRVAVLLVHHNRKGPASGGQSLRGSGDFHAWVDSALYLSRHRVGLEVVVEHRSAASPPAFRVQLAPETQPYLRIVEVEDGDHEAAPRDLATEIEELLQRFGEPLGRSTIRAHLKVRNERLDEPLDQLARAGRIEAVGREWRAAVRSVPVGE